MKCAHIAVLLSLLTTAVVVAQEAAPEKPESEASELLTGLQDNSFLLEEGYNQDPGMVQHINLLLYDHDAEDWIYTFTQEWPVFSMKHQLSYTIPLTNDESDDGVQLGDIALNYRYQLVGDGESRLAVAPRLSVIFPSSEGNDATAVQFGLPVSTIFGPRLLGHTNLGATWFNRRFDTEYFAGQSLIVPITPRFNVLVEGLWTGTPDEHDLVISPGIRWAYNFDSGAQLVPGLAYVIDVDDDDGGDSILFYFSYENPFGRRK
jgi:hypothetical protein